MRRLALAAFGSAALLGCQQIIPEAKTAELAPPAAAALPKVTAQAIFAGGCFWCVEADFDKVPGVLETTSGFIGGMRVNPSYKEVSGGNTGHAEAVKIVYDPSKVTYAQLLDHFWKNIDPTVKDAQFCDHGHEYRSAIFVLDDEQRKFAETSKAAIEKSGRFKQIYTEINKATPFYPAEEYHQDYYKKNPVRYNYYRTGCGRDARLAKVWGEKK